MDFIDEEGFRANVGIILTDGGGQVLIAGRRGRTGWQFPQGGVRHDESVEAAMYRELGEEIGLVPEDVELIGVTRDWLRYRLPEKYVQRQRLPVCIGQKQRWFMLRLVGSEDSLRFDSTNEPEFERWRWVDYWTPVREVIYFKRAVYARALDELARTAFPQDPPALPEWFAEEKNLRNVVERRKRQASSS